jgi:two-component system chemotaxis sensor kinase CheA
LNDIFRTAHTIKGAAGFLGFDQVVEITHVTEDVLNKLRKGEMAVNPTIMDAVLNSADLIRKLILNIQAKKEEKLDLKPVIKALNTVLADSGDAVADEKAAPKAKAKSKAAPKAKSKAAPKSKAKSKAAPKSKSKAAPKGERKIKSTEDAVKAVESIEADMETVEAIEAAKQEAGDAAPPSDEAEVAAPAAEEKAAPPLSAPEQQVQAKEQSIRVDTERLDATMNLVGELVLARNRMMMLGGKLSENNVDSTITAHMNEGITQLDLVTSDLQVAVMKMRMQPIAKVFNKFPRMVRDLARQSGKEIELVIKGEETELDKTVIEEIGDPLVHLVRNSIDHGIELPDDRESAGKARGGTLTLSAYQEGRHIIVCVEDDGKGIDPEAMKASAMEKGVLSAEDAEKMSDGEARNLIFAPGFSTAKVVSNISGRGVGMDVVKTNISRINGVIEIESEVGKGTKMVFRLPLTLAIIPVLTVEADSELYGIPLSTVVENIRLSDGDINTVNGREVIHLRERVLPVLRLATLVGAGKPSTEVEGKYVVLISIGDRMFGILVDKLHGQEDIVMKSMGEYLKGTEGIAGACITGDGRVVLILDLISLMEVGSRLSAG